MEENDHENLDVQFRKYLQILRPYLAQVDNSDVTNICNAWIQRLSECDEEEKLQRNKYIFALCYQLSKGTLEEPFLHFPPRSNLVRISESLCSDSSTEVECLVINSKDPNTGYDSKQNIYENNGYLTQDTSKSNFKDSDTKSSSKVSVNRQPQPSLMCFPCPNIDHNFGNFSSHSPYESRASNLITKLRDLKNQNIMLHKELINIKECCYNPSNSFVEEDNKQIDREYYVDHATSTIIQSNDSSTTLKSLKCKLQEVQESRNSLINKIASLQEQLDNFNDMKKHEFDDREAKYKLEMIETKKTLREDLKIQYEKMLAEQKEEYESKIEYIKSNSMKVIHDLTNTKDKLIEEKDKAIQMKDSEIAKLNTQIDDLKDHLHTVLEKYVEKPSNNSGDEILKVKAQQLERRVNKMEKSKIKCAKVYEARLAQLQRDKHLAECSLQLQMVRHRTQAINEATDENQTDLNAALSALEAKYKDIVANVQATAIQRRMQDQMALESILHAACGISGENNNSSAANGQFSKSARCPNHGIKISPLFQGNKVQNVCSKSFGDDNRGGYSLNGERIGELFEKVCVPQRDNPEVLK